MSNIILTLLFLCLTFSSIIYGEGPPKKKVRFEKLPKFELGLGLFAFRLRDYRGADQFHNQFWPIPYFIYRGDSVEIENSAIKGDLYEKGRFRVTMSLMGSFRVNSEHNKAREGMPSLDPTVEAGPALIYDWWISQDGKQYSSLGLPIRSAYSAEFFYAHHIGYFIVPYITYNILPQKSTLGQFFQFSWAMMFATQKYHSYFYDIAQEQATPNRPYYRANGGYSGWHTTFYTSRRFSKANTYCFFFARYDRLEKAAFAESPLVKKKDYLAFGAGLIWYFYQSENKAKEVRMEK